MTDKLTALVQSVAPHIDFDAIRALPAFSDKKSGAEAISRFLFPVSPRTLEGWGLPWRQINGRASVPTAELLAEAVRRVAVPSARGRAGFKYRAKAPAADAAALALPQEK